MAFKRIIGVLTVKDGRLVKSYGYTAWRPAGRLGSALRNLDRWGADEIVVLDISRRAGLDDGVLREIAAARIATPLAYGGGIRSVGDIRRLMDLGCDRFVVESLLFADPAGLREMAAVAGRQALIGSLPLKLEKGVVSLWRPTGYEPLALWRESLLAAPVSEFLLTSVPSEGGRGTFPAGLVEAVDWLPDGSAILFGGLDGPAALGALARRAVTAVAFGNLNHETELALPRFRRAALAGGAPDALRAHRLP